MERPKAAAVGGADAPEASTVALDPPRRRIRSGDRIDRYVVERRLGAGGMGIVYLARDPDLERLVAIKLVRPGLSTGRVRLLREGQAVARLKHPNVVTVFDVGSVGDDLFIAMEYVPGTTLDRWLRAGPRPWPEILDHFVAAGRGLAAAHRAGLVHRDFKPENVLLGDDGRVVVSDFGLVRADDTPSDVAVMVSDIDVTRTVGVVGTPAYMSPEQFLDRPLDPRSDQFSFCVALWEALFGVRPFERPGSATSRVEDLMRDVLAGQLQRPRRSGVPTRLVRVLKRGLAVARGGRFASMDDLLDQLRPPRRGRLVAAAGAVVAAILAGAAVVAAARAAPPPGPAVAVMAAAPCELETGRLNAVWNDRVRAAYVGGGADAAATEDAAWFDVYARRWSEAVWAVCGRPRDAATGRVVDCLGDAAAALERAIARLDRAYLPELPDPRACARPRAPEYRELRTSLGNVESSGALAPDGSRIAFATARGVQALIGSDGKSQGAERLYGVDRIYAWSPDGRYLLARAGGDVVRIDFETAVRTRLAWPPDVLAIDEAAAVAVHRDGDGVAFLGADGAVRSRVPVDGQITGAAIEPGAARAALVGRGDDQVWFLIVADVATGRRARRPLRVHGKLGGVVRAAWAGPGRLLVSGGVRGADGEGVWALDLDDAGDLAGPPWVAVPTRRDSILDLAAIRGDRALVVAAAPVRRVLRWRAGQVAVVPGLVDGDLGSVDARHQRVLLTEPDQGAARALVLGVDGELIGAGADDGVQVLYDGGLWFARADGRDLVLRDGAAPDRPELRMRAAMTGDVVRMQCSAGDTRRCVAVWDAGDRYRYAAIAGRKVRELKVPVDARDLDLAPDGARVLAYTAHEIHDYALASRRLRLLHREPGCEITSAVWSPSGRAIHFSVRCPDMEYIRVIAARPRARPRTLIGVDATIGGLGPLGEDDVVYSTLAYDSRLVVVENLPLTAR